MMYVIILLETLNLQGAFNQIKSNQIKIIPGIPFILNSCLYEDVL